MMPLLLGRLAARENLGRQAMAEAVDCIMRGEASDEEIALLLTGLRHKGETVEEVAGAAEAMRRHMTPIRTTRTGLIDTCGTGGDNSGTFNISTAAALVTAAAGVPVAKHGNRRVTSKTGSADVLQRLGVNVDAPLPLVEECLEELGICFCFAPLLHPAMRHVSEVRKKLGFTTIFNILGPLTNPAGASFQVLGVGRRELRDLLAGALRLLGIQHAAVVHGADGLDEVTLAAITEVTEVTPEETQFFRWQPEDFGLRREHLDALAVDGPDDSAALIRAVLAGEPGPPRDITILNSAAALWTAGVERSLTACARRAAEAIDSGQARELLVRLAQKTNRLKPAPVRQHGEGDE